MKLKESVLGRRKRMHNLIKRVLGKELFKRYLMTSRLGKESMPQCSESELSC